MLINFCGLVHVKWQERSKYCGRDHKGSLGECEKGLRLHSDTFSGLTSGKSYKEEFLLEIARKYKECMNDMEGRKPGPTSIKVNKGTVWGWRSCNPSDLITIQNVLFMALHGHTWVCVELFSLKKMWKLIKSIKSESCPFLPILFFNMVIPRHCIFVICLNWGLTWCKFTTYYALPCICLFSSWNPLLVLITKNTMFFTIFSQISTPVHFLQLSLSLHNS